MSDFVYGKQGGHKVSALFFYFKEVKNAPRGCGKRTLKNEERRMLNDHISSIAG